MHNWLIHRSGINRTEVPRRAFTACYLDSRTRNILTGQHFPLILGSSTGPDQPFLELLRDEHAAQTASASSAAEYARSLEAEVARLRVAAERPAAGRAPAGVAELPSALAKAGLERGRVLLRRFRPAQQ